MDHPSVFESLNAARPLAGIAVAELSGDVAVRYCGRLFSRLGASVVRVRSDDADISDDFAAWLDQGKRMAGSADEALGGLDGADHRLPIAGQYQADIGQAETHLAAIANAPTLLAITWFD